MFPHLNAPITVGGVTLPNRIVMGSMHLGLETAPDGFERLAAFYVERARGGVGLIVTGGVAPNLAARFDPQGPVLSDESALPGHLRITQAVHAAGGRIALQILHTGRYGQHADIVAPSPIQAPINRIAPREMTEDDIAQTIADFINCARLAGEAGYDGVEIMASEGYLLSEFLAKRTNKRSDGWGESLDNRMRLLIRIVEGIHKQSSPSFLLLVRLSVADLVEDGLSADEVIAVAQAVEKAGASILSTGIGWHESKIPTIAHMVPGGAWSWAAARVKQALSIPVVASNRITTPQLAEAILARGDADLVALARPLLADADFAVKAATNKPDSINQCIGCNQGCLDAMFNGQWCSCLVNPRAGRELDMPIRPAPHPKRIAVVGGGPAGLAFATVAAQRGHAVTLFEAAAELGGQFLLARLIPGKKDYQATPDYFARELAALNVDVRLNQSATAELLAGFDEIVMAAGTKPRRLDRPGADRSLVAGYEDILTGKIQAGDKVAILGSSGIGHDVAAFLLADAIDGESFAAAWGVDESFASPGALAEPSPPPPSRRQIVMMQRKPGRGGAGLGKTTGWIHRALLLRHGVKMLTGVAYHAIAENGIHVNVNGEEKFIEADTIVTCIGQESCAELADALTAMGRTVHRIGGAADAQGIDARIAMLAGCELGLRI
ncbi:MAG: FAD-dependent oxidoreductase [Rhodospirillales bacterium]|nr:FAD-dependent oxidoreductase [Rhodospirillales bacterium]